jgi:3-hydroxyisobutyrate dehydrogenase-like beta-hydroxyacid dehydrogenase
MLSKIALVGFGEAGSTFAQAANWQGLACAWDIAPARRAAMEDCDVAAPVSIEEALQDAELILSLVTADQALAVARDYAPHIAPGALWCDMNSVAPDTKRAAGILVEKNGGRYIDVAVLAPVHPARLQVPLLLSASTALDAEVALREAGFGNVRVVSEEIGQASAIKMIRSVMVKGIEALTDEMMQAAAAAGVMHEVLASLDASEKALSWPERAAYNLERMHSHGLRRAAEMEESAKTLESLGVAPVMTLGTVTRQRDAGLK